MRIVEQFIAVGEGGLEELKRQSLLWGIQRLEAELEPPPGLDDHTKSL